MDLGNGLGHLTYSTLVHPGDTWDDMWASLTTYVPQVKARVSPDRPFGVSLRLSNASAATLAGDEAPEGSSPSIQTAPLGFKPKVTDDAVVSSYTEHVLRVAAHLVGLEARTGRTVTLAIEPEPYCFLETTAETIHYFRDHLYSGA